MVGMPASRLHARQWRALAELVEDLDTLARSQRRRPNVELTLAAELHVCRWRLISLSMKPRTPDVVEEERVTADHLLAMERVAYGVAGLDGLIASFERHGLGEPISN